MQPQGPHPAQNPPGPHPPAGAYAPPVQKKGGGAKVAIILGVITLLAAGAIGGVVWYFFGATGSKVNSVAHEHLPEGCDVAIRLDMTALMKVKPVKEHVVSAIEDVMKEGENSGRLAAFLLAARMNPKKDIKDVAICLTNVKMGSDPDYGIAVGGKLLDEDGVVKAMDKHDTANELEDPKKVGDLLVLEDEEGVLISQSPDDAALLFAGGKSELKKIASKSDAFEDYEIPLDEQIVGVIAPKTVATYLGFMGPVGPNISDLEKVGRVVITMTLDPGELGMRMSFPDEDTAKSAKGQLATVFGMMGMAPLDAGMKKAMSQAKLKTKGKDLIATFPIDEDSIEETCEELGKEIREQND